MEVVRQRLRVYHQRTAPLIDYYEGHGKVAVVDGEAAIEDVSKQIDEEDGKTAVNATGGALASGLHVVVPGGVPRIVQVCPDVESSRWAVERFAESVTVLADDDDVDRMIDVNLRAPIRLMREGSSSNSANEASRSARPKPTRFSMSS